VISLSTRLPDNKELLSMRTTILTLLLLAFVAAGCGKKNEKADGAAPAAAQAKNVSSVVSVEPREGRAPNFTWKDASGQTVSFDTFKGSVTLVNFWATWCVPCKKEIPDLIAISNELAAKNVKIIGISTDRGLSVTEDVAAFVTEKGIPYQILISTDDLESAFGNIRMIPASFIVDADGKIVKELVGLHSKEAFVAAITAAIR
jgi:thiol-disulfide isomerase/thioredoxin